MQEQLPSMCGGLGTISSTSKKTYKILNEVIRELNVSANLQIWGTK